MKSALLVSNCSRPENQGLALSGTTNDVILLGKTLTRRYRFHEIRHLRNRGATLDRVLSNLNQMIKAAGPGDDLLFYFSGHGSTIPDLNNDEGDKYDECLVLNDHHIDNAFTDDKLYEAIKPLHEEAFLTIIIDSCHAAGMADYQTDFQFKHDAVEGYNPDTEYRVDNTKKFGKKTSPDGPSSQRHVLFTACPEGGLAMEQSVPVKVRRGQPNQRTKNFSFGVFTRSLVATMQSRLWNKSWARIHRATSNAVLRKTEGAQVPLLYGAASLIQRGPFGPPRKISNPVEQPLLETEESDKEEDT